MLFELAKCYTQLQLRRAINEDEDSLTGVSLHTRVLGCAAEYLSFAWFLYGSVLYHNTDTHSELGVMFSSFFCCVLIYGYTYMLKCAFECTLVFCVAPIWSCLYCLYPSSSGVYNLTSVEIKKLPKGRCELGLVLRRTCSICLIKFQRDVQITYLPCDTRHNFHTKCIEQWLKQDSKCPICNTRITPSMINECKSFEEMTILLKDKEDA